MLPIIPLSLQNLLLIILGSEIKKFFVFTFFGVLLVGSIICYMGYNIDLVLSKNILTFYDFFQPIFVIPVTVVISLIIYSKFLLKKINFIK